MEQFYRLIHRFFSHILNCYYTDAWGECSMWKSMLVCGRKQVSWGWNEMETFHCGGVLAIIKLTFLYKIILKLHNHTHICILITSLCSLSFLPCICDSFSQPTDSILISDLAIPSLNSFFLPTTPWSFKRGYYEQPTWSEKVNLFFPKRGLICPCGAGLKIALSCCCSACMYTWSNAEPSMWCRLR